MRSQATKREREEAVISAFMEQYAAALDAGVDSLIEEEVKEEFPPELDQRCRALIQQVVESEGGLAFLDI